MTPFVVEVTNLVYNIVWAVPFGKMVDWSCVTVYVFVLINFLSCFLHGLFRPYQIRRYHSNTFPLHLNSLLYSLPFKYLPTTRRLWACACTCAIEIKLGTLHTAWLIDVHVHTYIRIPPALQYFHSHSNKGVIWYGLLWTLSITWPWLTNQMIPDMECQLILFLLHQLPLAHVAWLPHFHKPITINWTMVTCSWVHHSESTWSILKCWRSWWHRFTSQYFKLLSTRLTIQTRFLLLQHFSHWTPSDDLIILNQSAFELVCTSSPFRLGSPIASLSLPSAAGATLQQYRKTFDHWI